MSSAARFTNRRRILAEVNNTKVQYPGSISVNINPLYSTINCNPNYDVLTYISKLCCKQSSIQIFGCIIDGGTSTLISDIILNGGDYSLIFDGNGNCDEPIGNILDGGNYQTNPNIVYDGGNYSTENVNILDGNS